MDENIYKQLVAQLIESQSKSLQVLAVAVSRQLDKNRLVNDLIEHGELLDSQGKLPELSKRFVKEMAGAVLADQK